MKIINLAGQKIDMVTVLERAENKYKTQINWKCKCDCGNEFISSTKRLMTSGGHSSGGPKIKSCGCKNYSSPHNNQKYDPKKVSYKAYYNRCKQTAKHRKIDFNLSLEEVILLTKQKCYYCGIDPYNKYNVYISKNGNHRSETKHSKDAWIVINGIDRINSDEDYEIGNVVSCCTKCNFAKNEMTQKEFFKWVRRIYENCNDFGYT